MNRAYFVHTMRANALRLVVVAAALMLWGGLLPVIYDAFGAQFEALLESGIIPEQLTRFGGGNVFSLAGSVALGFIHPFAVALVLVFAVGYASTAIAGERQRGTLEVLLARPIPRRVVYGTAALAVSVFIGICVAALAAGALVGTSLTGRAAELGAGNLPIVWLNATLLFGAFAAISLAASASFDRLTPAVGVSLAVVLVSYVIDVLGDLWPDAAWLQPYSLFHYLDPQAGLAGLPAWGDFALLAGVIVVAVAYALVVFPRRDLAAPS
jgi:ABC-type transport system involved in multi-copper enzyme maturation permease subunit